MSIFCLDYIIRRIWESTCQFGTIKTFLESKQVTKFDTQLARSSKSNRPNIQVDWDGSMRHGIILWSYFLFQRETRRTEGQKGGKKTEMLEMVNSRREMKAVKAEITSPIRWVTEIEMIVLQSAWNPTFHSIFFVVSGKIFFSPSSFFFLFVVIVWSFLLLLLGSLKDSSGFSDIVCHFYGLSRGEGEGGGKEGRSSRSSRLFQWRFSVVDKQPDLNVGEMLLTRSLTHLLIHSFIHSLRIHMGKDSLKIHNSETDSQTERKKKRETERQRDRETARKK